MSGSAEATDTEKRRREESPAAVIFTMKTLIVFALVCAMMVLTGAARPPKGRRYSDLAERRLVKRSISCPWGWSDYSYCYVPTRMTWAKAERNCQSMGGHLASVDDFPEDQEIQMLILTSTHSNDPTWIGGSDAQELNEWCWSDGTPFGYANFCSGQPNNNRSKEHCLQMNHSAVKCWDGVECSAQLPSVCAKKRQ